MDKRVEELTQQIDEALDNGNRGEAEELYRELEELCNEMEG